MRIFCAILFLGVVDYVQAVHDCADFAVNVEESNVQRQDDDAKNKSISLRQFVQKKTSMFYTVEATPNGTPAANYACTAPTYGMEKCGGVEYARKLIDDHDKYDENLLFKAIQFETTFIGYNTYSRKAIEYKMTYGGIDEDDLIFKHVEGTEIKAYKINDIKNPTNKTETIIDSIILNVLKSEFALFSYKPGGYNLYVTCNGETAWVTYDKGVPFRKNDPELIADIEKLKSLVFQKKKKTLDVEIITKTFPEPLTRYLEIIYAEPPPN